MIAGDKYEHFLISVLESLGYPILSSTREYITKSSKIRNRNAAARRTEKSRLTRYASQCHNRSNNSMRLHMSWWQRYFQFNGESTSHTGSKKNKSLSELGLGTTVDLSDSFDFTGWTLVLFDLNGTILYREWLGFGKGYGPCVIRPGLKELWDSLYKETKTLLGVWTGATSVPKLQNLLKNLCDKGINDWFIPIGSLPGCKTRKKFDGTTKTIVVKPVSILLEQILPKLTKVCSYCSYVLLHK